MYLMATKGGKARQGKKGGNSAAIGPFRSMVPISITQAAYDAIRSTFLDLPGDGRGPMA